MANLNTNTVTRLFDISTDGAIADELGALRAKIKELKDQQTFLEGLLKDKGVTAVDGSQYHVSISYEVQSQRTDWRKVAEHFNPSRQLLAAHSKTSIADRVRVTALTK